MTSVAIGFKDTESRASNTRNGARTRFPSVQKVSIGVIVRNEEKNIQNLLQSLSIQKLNDLVIDEIIVVSSGSEDDTNRIVLKQGKKDTRVRLVIQNEAQGKASGINEFLEESRNEIVIVTSGDVVFNEKTIQNLVSPLLLDKRCGLASAKPIPTNDSRSFMGTVTEIHWRLHNKLERHGETIAFRKRLIDQIPNEVSADEAYVEAAVHQRAFKTVQVSDSIVFNKGSENLTEFLNQIRRHYAGHLFIKAQESYLVSSMTLKGSAKIVIELTKYLREYPKKSYQVVAYVLLESLGRVLGIWDFYVRKRHYRVWTAAYTTKILNQENTTGP
jgi:glycosyltransferase involved in cell wall biosynthesis